MCAVMVVPELNPFRTAVWGSKRVTKEVLLAPSTDDPRALTLSTAAGVNTTFFAGTLHRSKPHEDSSTSQFGHVVRREVEPFNQTIPD